MGDASGATQAESVRNALLRAVQAGVPFTRHPFAALGEALDLSEAEVVEGLRELREQKILREISAVLEGSVLGYDSALVAGEVSPDRLDAAVEVVNRHPTVTHNYLRNHRYNLWFTLAVPPHMSLEATLGILAREAGVGAFQPLRRTHTFKIGVNFDPETMKNRTAQVHRATPEPIAVSDGDALQFRALQTPLPLEERPFDVLADSAGVSTDALLSFAKLHLGGAIRRYVGTLRHRRLGVRENGMVVWRVPDERVEAVGSQLASAEEVSHCYARNPIDGFPYTLYSMVHGPDRAACEETADRLAERTGIADYAVLFSEREFKKARLRYFLPELDAWWNARAGSARMAPAPAEGT
jgi:DNA-binding Lrp family transcriptional regulator